MIETTSLWGSLGETEGGEEGVDAEGTKASGRIGPSKMSTHSFTFSVFDDLGVARVLIRGGCGGRTAGEDV
jgi:hypothetical protein